MIKIILFIHRDAGLTGKRLFKTMWECFQETRQEYYDGTADFQKRLCGPISCKEQEICVVLADTPERLDRLIEFKKLLDGRRLVLILLENKKEILSKGHLLQPRYVSFGTGDFEDLVSVIEKMTGALKQNEKFILTKT